MPSLLCRAMELQYLIENECDISVLDKIERNIDFGILPMTHYTKETLLQELN